jgi:hypothetical protein
MMGSEAILFTPALGLALARLLALLLIPLLPVAAALRAIRLIGPAHTRLSPALEIAAVAVGALAAPLLLSAYVPWLGLAEIFRTGGTWDLDFHGFLLHRAWPLLFAPLGLVQSIMAGQAGPDVTRGSIFLGTIAALVVLGPVLLLRSRNGLASSIRVSCLIFWAAYVTIYVVVSLLWLANWLNFWCFLVLFAALSMLRD